MELQKTNSVVKHPNKRVNVISIAILDKEGKVVQEGGMIMRTLKSYAAQLVAKGTHHYTTKGKLRSFINKDMKLFRNARELSKIDLKDKKAGHVVFNDSYSGKTYVGIKKKDVEVIMMSKEKVDPNTGKPVEHKVMQPRHELRVARYFVS